LFFVILLRFIGEFLYSISLGKKFYPFNHILTGVTYGAVPILAAISLTSLPIMQFLDIIVLFSILSVTMSPLKDIDDYEGDRKYGIKTFVVLSENKKPLPKIIFLNVLILAIFAVYSIFFNFILLLPTLLSIFLFITFLLISTKLSSIKSYESFLTKISMLLAIGIVLIYTVYVRLFYV
jgi:4-hydroxybenzoate polyprenyltransferase